MLYFSIVTREDLCAVTHQDGSARVQTVADDHDALFVNLLDAFEELTGVGVLCNTSLNFPSCGFINTLGDLIRFVEHGGIDGVVVDRVLYDTKSI